MMKMRVILSNIRIAALWKEESWHLKLVFNCRSICHFIFLNRNMIDNQTGSLLHLSACHMFNIKAIDLVWPTWNMPWLKKVR